MFIAQIPSRLFVPDDVFARYYSSVFAAFEKPSSFQSVISYVIHTPDIPGKFQPARARALGVTPGPMFGTLQRGESVTLESGRVVHPEEVMEASTPGVVMSYRNMRSPFSCSLDLKGVGYLRVSI